jgi:hypothetical protein
MVVAAQVYRLAMVLLAHPYDAGVDHGTTYTQLGAWLPNHLDMFAAGMAIAVIVVERDDRGPGRAIGRRLDAAYARRGAAGASVLLGLLVLWLAGCQLGLSRTDLSYGQVGEFVRHGATWPSRWPWCSRASSGAGPGVGSAGSSPRRRCSSWVASPTASTCGRSW